PPDQRLDPRLTGCGAAGERLRQPLAPPRAFAPIPVGPVGGGQAQQLFIVTFRQGPGQGGGEVLLLRRDLAQPRTPVVISALRRPLVGQREEEVAVARSDLFRLTRLIELL